MAEETKRTPLIKVDNKVFKLEDLSDTAKKIVASIQMTDQEMERAERSMTIARAARSAYTQALIAATRDLTPVEAPQSGENKEAAEADVTLQ